MAKIEQNKNSDDKNVANEKKDRKFALVLYPDSQSYDCEAVLENVRLRCPEWSYILHNRDCDDDGLLVKEHYHVLIRYDNPRTCSSVLSVLGLPQEEYIVCPKSYKSYLKYLVHATDDSRSKYQYPVSEVVSNISNLEGQIMGTSEVTYLNKIYGYIDENPLISFPTLSRWVLSCGDGQLWSVFRRNASIIKDCLYEATRLERDRIDSVCTVRGNKVTFDTTRSLKSSDKMMSLIRETLENIDKE